MTTLRHDAGDHRLHALDAVRGFALLLGVAFHAALSFMPGWPPGLWAMSDNSPSAFLSDAAFVAHVFRMTLFFFIAGYFARLLQHQRGTMGFWRNRAQRIALPLIIGWVVVYPAIQAAWIAGLVKQFGPNLPPMPDMPKIAGAFPLTHLWFLYQLLMLYVGASLLHALVARLDADGRWRALLDSCVHGVLRAPIAALLLAVPVAAALLSVPMWFYWTGIPTPDQTLIPQLAPCVGYGVAFGFGWLVHRSRDALALIARHWAVHLAIGVVAVSGLLYLLHTLPPMAERGVGSVAFAYGFGVASWGLALGLTGMALRFLSAFSAWRRYVADASYWIYIAHLPVVAALQVWVGQWSWHWSVKFPFVVVTSLALLFASYHLLVRSTPIGLLLNGRRYPFFGARAAAPVEPASKPMPVDAEVVASLQGVVKQFGEVTALRGVDVQVRRGELLALLGPNGAGKSTAIALWLGLIDADAGAVALLGGAPQDVARRKGLGVMMQDVELPKELRVRELVRLASSFYDDPLPLEETLRRAGVTSFADRAYGKLSGGQKRLAQFAVAICGQPRVLFLDEPSVGLDVQARAALWTSIRGLLDAGCSIVLTTHYLEEAEALADRVTVIGKGRVIASGSVDDMRALVERREIGCQTRLGADEVRAWPGVSAVRAEHDRLNITATDAEGVVRRLLASDPELRRLEVRQAGLNEAFQELTREAA